MNHQPSDRIGRDSMKKTCKWADTLDECGWSAECGMRWWLEDGTPQTNGMIYCPKCGKRIKEEAVK